MYFGTSRGNEIAKTCLSTSIASSNSEVTELNISKNRGHHGKYTPEQKAIIGNSTAEHGVVVHPRPLYIGGNLVPQLSLSKLEPIALCVHDGCGLYLTRPQFFYHESRQIQASTKIVPPPPPRKNTRYTVVYQKDVYR